MKNGTLFKKYIAGLIESRVIIGELLLDTMQSIILPYALVLTLVWGCFDLQIKFMIPQLENESESLQTASGYVLFPLLAAFIIKIFVKYYSVDLFKGWKKRSSKRIRMIKAEIKYTDPKKYR